MMKGLVTKSTGSWYTVLTEDEKIVQCRIKGKFRIKGIVTTNPVTVGDRVEIETFDDGTGLITSINERKNYIIRKATRFHKEAHLLAANIDQAVLMLSLRKPSTPREFIDRFLITAEAYHIPAILVVNKLDLLRKKDQAELEDFVNTYYLAGYKIIQMSIEENYNLEALHQEIKGKLTLLAGNSGVGKSTFINRIAPGLDLKTSDISDYHKSGKHTTTFSEVFQLEKDTYIIDSPGIKAFGLIDLEKAEIGLYFPEIFRISKDCKFTNCTHVHEPGCAVYEAVQNGEIGLTRYKSYLNIVLEEDSKYRQGH